MNSIQQETESAGLPVYAFGAFRLDLQHRLLLSCADDRPLPITPRVLDTLVHLVQNPGALLARDTLMDSIWPDAEVEPNNLSQNVAKLRRLLGERPGENRFIETVPGRGYRFIAEVRIEMTSRGATTAAGDPRRTQSGEADQLYRQALRLLQRPTAENCRVAVEHLEAALKLDPRFALAWAWLADAHLLAVNVGHALAHDLAGAERHAGCALELDPELATAHAVMGAIRAQKWDWLAAESHCVTAVSLDVADAMARTLHATFVLQQVGHTRRALAQLRHAFTLQPDDPRMLLNLAMANSIVGHDEEASRCAQLAVGFGFPEKTFPLPLVFANRAARLGRYSEALEYALHLLPQEVSGAEVVRLVYAAFEETRLRERAIGAVDQLLNQSLETLLPVSGMAMLFAQWLAQLDRLDLAFDVAHRSIDVCAHSGVRPPNWQTLWLPELRAFRTDGRFRELATRLGLPLYWERFGPPDN